MLQNLVISSLKCMKCFEGKIDVINSVWRRSVLELSVFVFVYVRMKKCDMKDVE